MTSSSHTGALTGSRQEEQARALGFRCPTIWLQRPHFFFISLLVVNTWRWPSIWWTLSGGWDRCGKEEGEIDVVRKKQKQKTPHKASLRMLSGKSPGGTVIKNPLVNAGDAGSIRRSGRYPGVGNCNPFQYACLENSMDSGVWRATVHGAAKSRMCAHTHAQC